MHPAIPVHSVLLVEDDPMIARTLSMGLRYEGFALSHAASVAAAMQLLQQQTFDLILLDVGLPDGDGISLCRQLRVLHPATPILMLSARADESAVVASIEGGADDYIRKPCGLRELSARMRRLLGQRQSETAGRPVISYGAIRMDSQRRTVSVGDTPLQLGKKEYEVLMLLVRANGDAITREQILNQFEDSNVIYDRTIDSHLSHLRRKLKDASAVERIVAIYGVGYKLESA
ncbi:response regulator transcription factor [Undibacterium sp. CY18W]|uniref:Response regulator transcription factor n=1 Tax=Undibacterium hunanense TaxID=2762292 RepID=A0ABR6ZSY3_9BURK|nr:response regulator transcription factor [Undibacterium hunanense]MBC3918985.1 response regulator transcription factor [Undibacterium hunanense]